MRFVTSHVQLRIQRICLRLPTSPKTSNPVTTTAMSLLLLMWWVLTPRLSSDSPGSLHTPHLEAATCRMHLTFLAVMMYSDISVHVFISNYYTAFQNENMQSVRKCNMNNKCFPSSQNLAYEIILTLGQAFEVAYQLALQARKSGHGSATLPESFDSKPGKPVPKPRVNIRKSVSIHTAARENPSNKDVHLNLGVGRGETSKSKNSLNLYSLVQVWMDFHFLSSFNPWTQSSIFILAFNATLTPFY